VREQLPDQDSAPRRVFEDDRDWQLLRRVGDGDIHAFEELYRQYFDYLSRFVYQVTRRVDLIEDVVNDVMLVVWRKAAATTPRAKASTWILGIAYNVALKSCAPHRAAAATAGPEEEDHDPGDESEWLAIVEADDLLLAALDLLPTEQRAVLELVYYHGLHYREIAEVMHCPENTVKTRVFHARRKLLTHWTRLTGTKRTDARDPDERGPHP
jgi:RNA polymerase sigma-70 factor (ECF subfamily)